MNIGEALDAMRAEISECSLVAYADLSSGLVLSTSAITNPGQELLDALSGAAVLALDGALAEGSATFFGGAAQNSAMLLTSSEARVFLRSPGAAREALICVCTPDADLDTVMDCGQATMRRILAQE